MYNIILKKKRGGILTKSEIDFVVRRFTKGEIPDYQMSALLMAICLNGMTKEETVNLTLAMAESGDMLDLSSINGIKADKHSTGGVGDKTSLVVAPIAAANGVAMAKMSGKGLGHTGGTIDKLQAIPGFRTALSNDEFMECVRKTGIAIVEQSLDLAPADKKIYALRDVTATVDSMPLIASSIMSKKLAAGADVIVLDVKTGSGAFMKKLDDALALAREMIEIGEASGRKMYALISDMNQPLGSYVGNMLEVLEAVDVLKGKGPEDLKEACLYLSALIMHGAGVVKDIDEGTRLAKETISSGRGLEKFKEFVSSQGGSNDFIDNPSKYLKYSRIVEVKADEEGSVSSIDTEKVGLASMKLGGGREKKEDLIDPSVGIKIEKKLGDKVTVGDTIASLYVNSEEQLESAIKLIKEAYSIKGDKEVSTYRHLYGYFKELQYTEV
jgi:pyrimidine-nucleoside phosphorylase